MRILTWANYELSIPPHCVNGYRCVFAVNFHDNLGIIATTSHCGVSKNIGLLANFRITPFCFPKATIKRKTHTNFSVTA